MIPYSYNMVDMGGIDLAEANGTVVEGLYNRLTLARNACGDLILYNWKFAEIEIAPGICTTLDVGTSILINGLIQVTELDEVTILGLVPPPPVIEPLEITENGVYEVEDPVVGFNPVTVNVASGFTASVCELFRHIVFSNSATDKLQRSDRWFQRNTNEPVLFLSAAYLQNNSIAYSGYAAISFSSNGVTGTYSAHGDLTAISSKTTPNGTTYYVQVMNGMYPPSVASGKVQFIYASNYEFFLVPNLANLLIVVDTKDFIGNQNLVSLMYTLIDAIYNEYYS